MRLSERTRRTLFWLSIPAALCAMIALLLGGLAGQPKPSLAASTFNSSPFGTKAFFDLLNEMGFSPSRFTKSFTCLPDEGLLFVLAPSMVRIEETEARHLLGWVQKGNTAIFASGAAEGLSGSTSIEEEVLEVLGVELAEGNTSRELDAVTVGLFFKLFDEETIVEFSPSFPSRYSAGVEELAVPTPRGADLGHGGKVEIFQGQGVNLVSRVAMGEGNFIFLSSAALARNHYIGMAGNLRFLLNVVYSHVAYGRGVLFDEYHHGFRVTDYTIGNLFRESAFQASLAYLGLLVVFYFLRRGRRFGAIRPLPLPPRRSVVEFLASVSSLYMRARIHEDMRRLIVDSFKRDAVKMFGMSGVLELEDVMREVHLRASGARLKRAVLDFVQCAGKQRPNDLALLELDRCASLLRQELFGDRHLYRR